LFHPRPGHRARVFVSSDASYRVRDFLKHGDSCISIVAPGLRAKRRQAALVAANFNARSGPNTPALVETELAV
jgi:hypothetical protein